MLNSCQHTARLTSRSFPYIYTNRSLWYLYLTADCRVSVSRWASCFVLWLWMGAKLLAVAMSHPHLCDSGAHNNNRWGVFFFFFFHFYYLALVNTHKSVASCYMILTVCLLLLPDKLNSLTAATFSFVVFTTFGTLHTYTLRHTHTLSSTFTNTLSRLPFPSNQFETLLSETYFNVPVLFLLPLLFNTLLYYPLISSSLFPVFSLSALSIRQLCDCGSSHHAFRFQQTGDLRDTDTLANSFNRQHWWLETNAQSCHCCTRMHIRLEMAVMFSSNVIGHWK